MQNCMMNIKALFSPVKKDLGALCTWKQHVCFYHALCSLKQQKHTHFKDKPALFSEGYRIWNVISLTALHNILIYDTTLYN